VLQRLRLYLEDLVSGDPSMDVEGEMSPSSRWIERQSDRVERAIRLRPGSPRLLIMGTDVTIESRTTVVTNLFAARGYELVGYTRRARSPFFLARQLVFMTSRSSGPNDSKHPER
jgi:hypothetical protein